MILDNYATHKHANVNAWLAKHPRFHLHFTPTSSSWLNLVERRFREITDKAIRRGVFGSVPELIAATEAFLAANNAEPKPFVWTATAGQILAKEQRRRVALQQAATENWATTVDPGELRALLAGGVIGAYPPDPAGGPLVPSPSSNSEPCEPMASTSPSTSTTNATEYTPPATPTT